LTVSCPQCGSSRIFKDGLRFLKDGTSIQRWICRDCNYRFSDRTSLQKTPPSHFKNCNESGVERQVCELLTEESENLTEVINPSKSGLAGATTTHNEADFNGKIIEYMWYMKKQGYAETTIQTYAIILRMLRKGGADLYDQEKVKQVIAEQESWSKGRKWNVVKVYTLFLKMQGLTWEKPLYKPVGKIPFIPTEKEIDELIAGCSKQMATFLQVLKETGARRGEMFNLKWTDVDLTYDSI
jgi:hypothetical protein